MSVYRTIGPLVSKVSRRGSPTLPPPPPARGDTPPALSPSKASLSRSCVRLCHVEVPATLFFHLLKILENNEIIHDLSSNNHLIYSSVFLSQRLVERTRQRREMLNQKLGKTPDPAPRKRVLEDRANIQANLTKTPLPEDGTIFC